MNKKILINTRYIKTLYLDLDNLNLIKPSIQIKLKDSELNIIYYINYDNVEDAKTAYEKFRYEEFSGLIEVEFGNRLS